MAEPPFHLLFFKRPVHLLGGRPDVQRLLAEIMPVVSLDCNRFTLDTAFGDYFDGDKFRRIRQEATNAVSVTSETHKLNLEELSCLWNTIEKSFC
jgi:hypothetical protein